MKIHSLNVRFLPLVLFILALQLALGSVGVARTRAPQIEMSSLVTSHLQKVMDTTLELHQALVEQKDPLVITKIKELNLALSSALKTPDPDTQSKKHLDLILSDAQKALDQYSKATGEERRATLQHAFRQIVLVGQNYRLPDKVKFYFCRKDRSVWPQKTGKPMNPINPEQFRMCGQQVQ